MADKPMIVLLVEPEMRPVLTVLDGSLESMQKCVGGDIEQIMPYEDEVAIVCNEEGKIYGEKLNRAIYSEDGEILDIIAGAFFVCYAPAESECYLSLPEELIYKYAALFDCPENFGRNNQGIFAVKYPPSESQNLGIYCRYLKNANDVSVEFCDNKWNILDTISVPKDSSEYVHLRSYAKKMAGNLAIKLANETLQRMEEEMSVDAMLADSKARSEASGADKLLIDILQVKSGDEGRDFRFAPLRWLKEGINSVSAQNYNRVYQYPNDEPVDFSNEDAVHILLEKIFTKFNVQHPEDFTGHSLSVSDIVVLTKGNECQAFFCDSIGFQQLPDAFVNDFAKAVSKDVTEPMLGD